MRIADAELEQRLVEQFPFERPAHERGMVSPKYCFIFKIAVFFVLKRNCFEFWLPVCFLFFVLFRFFCFFFFLILFVLFNLFILLILFILFILFLFFLFLLIFLFFFILLILLVLLTCSSCSSSSQQLTIYICL